MGLLEPHERYGGGAGEADLIKRVMDADPIDDFDQASSSRLAAMFDAAIPEPKCIVCGHMDFSLLVSPKPRLITAVHYFEGSDPVPKQFTQTLAVACKNCGYVMQFAMPAIKALAKRSGWQDG
jgi:hypothetical protein